MKTNTQFQNATVLVVENFEFNQEIIVEMLHLVGITPDVANNGVEAVEMAKQKTYDLILMDLRMPLKDSYEAAKEIRALPIQQPIIVAVTSSALIKDRDKGVDVGMNDYVTKPMEFDQLEVVLKKHLPHRLKKAPE